jgi:hypothetical protein
VKDSELEEYKKTYGIQNLFGQEKKIYIAQNSFMEDVAYRIKNGIFNFSDVLNEYQDNTETLKLNDLTANEITLQDDNCKLILDYAVNN